MIELVFWISLAIVVYTYFGFPLILQLLVIIKKRFKRSQNLPDDNQNFWPRVTLLISAYNEEKVIEEKILNSLAINYPKTKFEILITSDGSDDGTPEIVKKFESKGVRLLHHRAATAGHLQDRHHPGRKGRSTHRGFALGHRRQIPA